MVIISPFCTNRLPILFSLFFRKNQGFLPIGVKLCYIEYMGRPKKYNTDTVIAQAMEAFWAKGYAATSMSDLTEVTGLNKKSLYNEFGSKEALFNIALNHYNQMRMPLIELLMRKPLGLENIKDYLSQLAEDSSDKGCLLALSINERNLLENKANKQIKADFQGFRKLFELNLAEAYRGTKKDSTAMALLLSSQMFSIAAMGKLKVSKKQLKASIDLLLRQTCST